MTTSDWNMQAFPAVWVFLFFLLPANSFCPQHWHFTTPGKLLHYLPMGLGPGRWPSLCGPVKPFDSIREIRPVWLDELYSKHWKPPLQKRVQIIKEKQLAERRNERKSPTSSSGRAAAASWQFDHCRPLHKLMKPYTYTEDNTTVGRRYERWIVCVCVSRVIHRPRLTILCSWKTSIGFVWTLDEEIMTLLKSTRFNEETKLLIFWVHPFLWVAYMELCCLSKLSAEEMTTGVCVCVWYLYVTFHSKLISMGPKPYLCYSNTYTINRFNMYLYIFISSFIWYINVSNMQFIFSIYCMCIHNKLNNGCCVIWIIFFTSLSRWM